MLPIVDVWCSGVCGDVPRLDCPGVCFSDAGNGLQATNFVNSWPSSLHIGALWNRNLNYQRALHMGAKFKTKDVHGALGAAVGPLGKDNKYYNRYFC
jgi:beta-glucosidase